jgi:hypothetical protein
MRSFAAKQAWDWIVLLLFIAICVVASANVILQFWPAPTRMESVLVVTAALASLTSLARVLPWPNVLLAGGLVAFVGALAGALSAVTGFPLGRGDFTAAAGFKWLGLIPWWLPVIWMAIALMARGTARLFLSRSTDHPRHGYRVIGVATFLAILANLGLRTYAADCIQIWQTGAVTIGVILEQIIQLFVQIGITPLLIDKYPGVRPANFHPALVWMGTMSVLALALLYHGQWTMGATSVASVIAVGGSAIRLLRFSSGSTRQG